MFKIGALVMSCALLWSHNAGAQDALPLEGVVARDIAAGESHSYTIQLNAGDYVAGVVAQNGIIVLATPFLVDGSKTRTFAAQPGGLVRFAFAAPIAGTYRLELRAPTKEEARTQGATQAATGRYELKTVAKLSLDERLSPAAPHDKFVSAEIEGLRAQISKGDADTGPFWKRVAETGTPRVEEIDKDPQHQLVTFLWRAMSDTRNVAVSGTFTTGRPTDYAMSHLATTDVWYLTVRLPRGARFVYRLSPNDPLTMDEASAEQSQATQQADPLNPHTWFCGPKASRFECGSLAELPGAPSQPWIVAHEGTPAGKVEKHTIKSDILKNERSLSIYTPPNYAPSRHYALLVVFDESSYLRGSLVPTPTILDNLIAAGKIPPTVAVLVGNPSQEARNKELPPNPRFVEFLAKELVPWVHAHYVVTNDPKLTVVAGSSYGGIAAVYAGLKHAEIFGNVLCQSGSFWWAPDHILGQANVDATTETGWLAKEFIKSPKLKLKFWMDAGLFEVDPFGTGGSILEPSRHMRDVLLAKGYEVTYHQYASGHDYINWRGTLGEGLIALIGTESARSKSTH